MFCHDEEIIPPGALYVLYVYVVGKCIAWLQAQAVCLWLLLLGLAARSADTRRTRCSLPFVAVCPILCTLAVYWECIT